MSAVRKSALLVIVLAALAALVMAFRPAPIPAAMVTVFEGPLAVSIRETGRTRVKDRFVISSPVQAHAPRIELEPGAVVSADQSLLVLAPVPSAVLDPRSLAEARARLNRNEAALQAAESRLEAISSELELAEHELERIRPLHEQGTVSSSQFEQSLTAFRRVSAEHRSAHFDVEAARQDVRFAEAALSQQQDSSEELQSFIIAAPVAGQVLDVAHESAGIVQAGQELLTLADPASLEVLVELLSADAVRVQRGMPVELLRWGGEDPLRGEVKLIERGGFTKVSALGVEEQRVNVIVDLVSPYEQWRALGDGYRVEARFILWEKPSVVQVPNGAVFRHNGESAVFRVIDGRARRQVIEVGARGETHVEIVSGLRPGETVIAHPDRSIGDGSRVEAFNA
jgi:HlyD family secretion protein